MKRSLCSLFFLVLLATSAVASTAPVATVSVDTGVTSVSDLLGTTPFWMNVETSFICPPDNGPYTCSYDHECQRYFMLPSNYVCVNPSGQLCGGHCEPC